MCDKYGPKVEKGERTVDLIHSGIEMIRLHASFNNHMAIDLGNNGL